MAVNLGQPMAWNVFDHRQNTPRQKPVCGNSGEPANSRRIPTKATVFQNFMQLRVVRIRLRVPKFVVNSDSTFFYSNDI